MTETKAVTASLPPDDVRPEAFAEASRFRGAFYACLTARRDELFELVDAVLCADGPVKSPVDLTLVPSIAVGMVRCTAPSTAAGRTSTVYGLC